MRRGRMGDLTIQLLGEVVEGGVMGYRAGQGEGCRVAQGLDEKGRVDDRTCNNTEPWA